jgi:hypothetical protein
MAALGILLARSRALPTLDEQLDRVISNLEHQAKV